jgi:outer membrane lipoprotein-sorting protein
MRFRTLFLAGLLACSALAAPGAVVTPAIAATAKPAPLTQQDRADIQRIEAYFDSIRSMQSKFLQLSDNGGVAAGKVYLSRPGKMRFEYDPPIQLLMVASNGILAYYDLKMQQENNVPLSATPVAILLSEHVRLGGDVTVTKFERDADTLRVTLQQTKDPAQGALTLVFYDKPLQLKQWSVLDAQGITTRVTLVDPQFGGRLDGKLFQFVNPRELNQRPGG